jgi:hypothetical protein
VGCPKRGPDRAVRLPCSDPHDLAPAPSNDRRYKADTAHFTSDAIAKAREPKELFWIDGATHVDLYDTEEYVPIAVEKMSGFFKQHLGSASLARGCGAA